MLYYHYLIVIYHDHIRIIVGREEVDNEINSKDHVHSYVKDIEVCIVGVWEGQAIRSNCTCNKDQSINMVKMLYYIVIMVSQNL